MGHSTDGATAAPAPCPAPAQVAKPAPEAPAEQMDHDSMPGMDMEPKAPSCSPEHAAMGHCTPEAAAPATGRASCRERVCPYVYISVGAVSLNKKDKLSISIMSAGIEVHLQLTHFLKKIIST